MKFYETVGKIKSDGLKPVLEDSCMFNFSLRKQEVTKCCVLECKVWPLWGEAEINITQGL